ncbi:MAG: TVP38/TMEM64 family protein [Anaerovoracaceae bacterium]
MKEINNKSNKIGEKLNEKNNSDNNVIKQENPANKSKNEEKYSKMTTKNKLLAFAKFGLLLLIVIGIPAYVFIFHYDLITSFKNIKEVEAFVMQYESISALVVLGLQVFQIIVSLLPGQWIQMIAGYLWGAGIGYLLSVAGAFIGTTASFFIAKGLGKDAVHIMFGEKKMANIEARLNSKRAFVIIFLMYLIPGFPKDLIPYAAGVSDVKYPMFILVSLIGRSPAMLGSIIIGSQLAAGSYTIVIILSIIAAILFSILLIKRKSLMSWMDKVYEKFAK